MSRMKNRPIFWPPRTVLDLRLMDRGLPPRFPLERWKLSRELDLFIFQFKKQRCVDCLPTVETCWYVMSSSDVVYARMALTKAVQLVQVLAEAKANKVEVKMEAFMLGKCWPVLFISLNACYLGIMGITQTNYTFSSITSIKRHTGKYNSGHIWRFLLSKLPLSPCLCFCL